MKMVELGFMTKEEQELCAIFLSQNMYRNADMAQSSRNTV